MRRQQEKAAEERGAARTIEHFQAAFLAVATAELPLAEFAVKGGVNMRFFLRSQRSSKDMDFDYLGTRLEAFSDRLASVMRSRALAELLRLKGIATTRLSHAKDTNTTQRWKLGLASAETPDASTKVEFSARGSTLPVELAPTDEALARRLGARIVRLNHYPPQAAAAQKVRALLGRSNTEPRDVFDLDHLIREYPGALENAPVTEDEREAAAERAAQLAYPDYEATVVPYLDEDLLRLLGSAAAWNEMQYRVIATLTSRGEAPR